MFWAFDAQTVQLSNLTVSDWHMYNNLILTEHITTVLIISNFLHDMKFKVMITVDIFCDKYLFASSYMINK